MIEKLHEGMKLHPKVNGHIKDGFTPSFGVQQGNLYLNCVMAAWDCELGKGDWEIPVTHYRDGKIRISTTLRIKERKVRDKDKRPRVHADDLTILQQGRQKFEQVVQCLFDVTRKFGLEISCEPSKTSAMRVRFHHYTSGEVEEIAEMKKKKNRKIQDYFTQYKKQEGEAQEEKSGTKSAIRTQPSTSNNDNADGSTSTTDSMDELSQNAGTTDAEQPHTGCGV